MNVYSDYDKFAWIYNEHWGDVFTNSALSVLERFVLGQLTPRTRILDLCCGTGNLAKVLSSRGYIVTGIDSSREMLRFARKNVPKCNFVAADARNFDLKQRVDVVISAFDSLNHILTLGQLKLVFEHTYRALKPQGVFVFDLNMERGFKARWRGSFGIVEDDHSLVARSNYDAKHRIGTMNITMFFLKGRSWTRSDLSLKEKAYGRKEIISSVKRAGFTRARAYDSRDDLGMQEVGRSFFIAEKST